MEFPCHEHTSCLAINACLLLLRFLSSSQDFPFLSTRIEFESPWQPGIFFRILGYIRQLWPLLRHLQLTLPQFRPEVSSVLLGMAPPHQCKNGVRTSCRTCLNRLQPVHEGPWIGCRRSQCMLYGHWLRVRRSLRIMSSRCTCTAECTVIVFPYVYCNTHAIDSRPQITEALRFLAVHYRYLAQSASFRGSRELFRLFVQTCYSMHAKESTSRLTLPH